MSEDNDNDYIIGNNSIDVITNDQKGEIIKFLLKKILKVKAFKKRTNEMKMSKTTLLKDKYMIETLLWSFKQKQRFIHEVINQLSCDLREISGMMDHENIKLNSIDEKLREINIDINDAENVINDESCDVKKEINEIIIRDIEDRKFGDLKMTNGNKKNDMENFMEENGIEI